MGDLGSNLAADPNEVALALYSLAATVVRRMPRDVSLTATATLYALERHGPQRVTHLAAHEGVTQPSMTALVTKLEDLGLAERRRDPSDGRHVFAALSTAGERDVTRAPPNRRRRARPAHRTPPRPRDDNPRQSASYIDTPI